MLLAATLVLELARESLTGSHCRYREYVHGLPTDVYVTRPCDAESLQELRTAPNDAPPSLRWIDDRAVHRRVVEETPLHPYAYDYDVLTGTLLRRTPLFFRGRAARVFDPNPVVTLNDASLQDGNDGADAVPASAYFDVELENTNPFGPLGGLFVELVDRQPRNVAPPPEGASLLFDREDDGFEDVSAYFHIDRSQRYLRSLGYEGQRSVAAYAIPVDAHAASGADDSFFLPSSAIAGRGSLFFGEGGTDDAEDADLLLHEYAHAIHEWIAPGTFGGSFASESRALAEGTADYWAYSAHAAARRAAGRDPFCFADWDARCALDDPSERCAYAPGADCLRRLDGSLTMDDFSGDDGEGVEHRNGSIWSSALREIHDRIGKHPTDAIVIESLFGAPPRPTFALMALRLLDTDRLLYGGTYSGAICSAMFTRGILTACDVTLRGELTHQQAPDRGVAIPGNNSTGIRSTITVTDPRTIEKLYVRVDIEHPSRGDLRVELTAPDGTTLLLHQISSVRSADIRETFGLTAVPVDSLELFRGRTAAGAWTLTVSDRRPLDEGTLLSWGLVIQFAGDVPLAVRPSAGPTQMIPVVAHLYGADERLYRSDVRIANPHDSSRTVMLTFTRSGEDGGERFAAVQVALAAGHTVAFDDVLASVFHTSGSGTLEVSGDVVVMSRTFIGVGGGTLGEQVPVDLESTALGETSLVVAPIVTEGSRYNVGIAEKAGKRGTVRVGTHHFSIEPYSHVQFPVVPELLEVRVIEGEARVVAYLSQVESGDAMFIPAERVDRDRLRIAPVITAQTSGSPPWRSDLWIAGVPGETTVEALPGATAVAAIPAIYEDVLARLFHRTVTLATLRVALPAGAFGATRIVSRGTTQFVPLLEPEGPALQHLLFLESPAVPPLASAPPSLSYRTNVGIVSAGPALAELTVYDSAGREVERQILSAPTGLAQTRVATTLVNGRGVVRFLQGSGRAYASLVDQGSGDATFLAAY